MSDKLLNKVRWSYGFMLIGYGGLLLTLLGQTYASVPPSLTSFTEILLAGFIIWLLKAIALLIFIPGFSKQSHKAAAWCSYVALLYFVFSVLLVFTPKAGLWGWLMVCNSTVLFISAMLFTRWAKALENIKSEHG